MVTVSSSSFIIKPNYNWNIVCYEIIIKLYMILLWKVKLLPSLQRAASVLEPLKVDTSINVVLIFNGMSFLQTFMETS